jgi:4-hydroxy-3-methylbut-2-enyl diphosphate reductase
MQLRPEIDPGSGFCYGVVRAINQAEKNLKEQKNLFSLGSIVHNREEVNRLEKAGLKVTDHKGLESMRGGRVLIRAHGEPPSTYKTAVKNNIDIVDCTCPVVLKLQERIVKGHNEIKKVDGTLIIFGKKFHAEVDGLLGQIDGDAVVVEKPEDLEGIDFSRPVVLFSQTTKEPADYQEIAETVKKLTLDQGGDPDKVIINNTICRQVSSRYSNLRKFASSHPVILFVSGKQSSNGKVLFETCKKANPDSHKIEKVSEIDPSWFSEGQTVGICGATSTPQWQLQEVAQYLKTL